MSGLCPHCQAALLPAAAFCAHCGKPVAEREPQDSPKTSSMAIAAFVLAFIPVCLNFVGLVLGIISLVRIGSQPTRLKGRGLAIAAIAVGSVNMVVPVLAAIAIPNFIKYQARAKQAEAKTTLQSLHAAYRTAQMERGDPPEDLEALGFVPPEKRRYAYFYANEVVQPKEGGPYALPSEGPELGDEVIAVAVGNIDSDPTLDVWTIDTEGQAQNVVNDLEQ